MKNEVRLEFTQWNPDETRIELNFTENKDEMDIYHFHDFCKRFATAVGYGNKNIEEVFGETIL